MTDPTGADNFGESGDAAGAGDEANGPVVRDRRKVDPLTGKVRQAYAETEPNADDSTPAEDVEEPAVSVVPEDLSTVGADAELAAAQQLAAERLQDLQRLNAEYVNYRKRVDRDRETAGQNAITSLLESLMPVLDDIYLARQHGDLDSGPFAAIADKLDATLERVGMTQYGEVGEPFDPNVHEALMHTAAELPPGTTQTTVVQVLQPGYRLGDRVLRAARVAVADPA